MEFYDCVLNNDLAKLEVLSERHKIDLNAKFTDVRRKNHLDLSPIHLVAYKGRWGVVTSSATVVRVTLEMWVLEVCRTNIT